MFMVFCVSDDNHNNSSPEIVFNLNILRVVAHNHYCYLLLLIMIYYFIMILL